MRYISTKIWSKDKDNIYFTRIIGPFRKYRFYFDESFEIVSALVPTNVKNRIRNISVCICLGIYIAQYIHIVQTCFRSSE